MEGTLGQETCGRGFEQEEHGWLWQWMGRGIFSDWAGTQLHTRAAPRCGRENAGGAHGWLGGDCSAVAGGPVTQPRRACRRFSRAPAQSHPSAEHHYAVAHGAAGGRAVDGAAVGSADGVQCREHCRGRRSDNGPAADPSSARHISPLQMASGFSLRLRHGPAGHHQHQDESNESVQGSAATGPARPGAGRPGPGARQCMQRTAAPQRPVPGRAV